MKKIFSTIAIVCTALTFVSCDDLFKPAQENNLGLDYMYVNPQYAEGILANGYTRIPIASYPFSEVATDDAVSNDNTNSWRKIASGTWAADNNPSERWQNCRAAIQYLNLFLANAEQVAWNSDETLRKMFCDREMGEAYALRAMYMYYLLEAHAGVASDGVLYGVPIVTEPEDQGSDFNKPRNTYQECVAALRADAAKALELLPNYFGNEDDLSKMMSKYPNATMANMRRVFGTNFIGRIDGHIVEAFLAKLDLMSASPRFEKSGVTWEDAAKSAATVLNRIGGVAGMDPTGWTWYCNTKEIEDMSMTALPKEVLWCGERGESNNLETDNYPPTLYGNGRINPTQNFVDAFGMADGTPIKEQGSGYNANNPYMMRDPRLAAYVVYNGQLCGLNGTKVVTAAYGNDNNAIDKVNGKSTRTGYYLRKLLRQDVNLDPVATTSKYHYVPRIRYTEIFLAYAEAANEAWGPTGNGGNAYSAYDVIKAIRKRAGVGGPQGDVYIEKVKGDKEKMRELIRNERRIELSFEGHRFWDLRRWNLNLNEDANGVRIDYASGSVETYDVFRVDSRNYKDYMYYGPLPYSEVLKFDALKQNAGW